MIYLIGSLANRTIPQTANHLEAALGEEVFDGWWSPGPETDRFWKEHELKRGRTYTQSLAGWHAQDVFAFDKRHLDRARAAVLVYPAGRSAHLELGYTIGRGKPGYILLDGEPERYDVMANFATAVCDSMEELIDQLRV